MVKDHSDSKRGNCSKGSFICIIPDRIIHTTAFVTPVMEDWKDASRKIFLLCNTVI